MSQAAKAQEPSMEEILASIRRIIADDDGNKPARAPEPAPAPPKPVAAAPPPPKPKPAPPPPPAPANSQDQVDAMLAELEVTPKPVPPKPAPPPPAPPKPAVEPPPTDVLDLTEAMTAPPAPSFRTIDAAADVVFTDRAPEPPPEPPAPPPVRQVEEPRPQFVPSPAPVPERAIISGATAAAVDSAFNSLAHVVLGNNARTLEDLVKEMLRPMLKSWLDDNLPSMVERIVRAEIERVSRGR